MSYIIITQKNAIFEYTADDMIAALNLYIEEVVGFERYFKLDKDSWMLIANSDRPKALKVETMNGLCKRSKHKISKIISGTASHPSQLPDDVESIEMPIIVTKKNKLYECDTNNIYEALNKYIEEVLGFEYRTRCSKNVWDSIANSQKPPKVRVSLINGFCRFSGDRIEQIVFGSPIYPPQTDGLVSYKIYKAENDEDDPYYAEASASDTLKALEDDKVNLIINSTYDDVPVTQIAREAFENLQNIQGVVVSKNIKKIGLYAFCNCNNLITVALPEELEVISDRAFSKCVNLKTINIPNTLTSAVSNTFAYSDKLAANFEYEGCSYLANPDKSFMILLKAANQESVAFHENLKIINANAFNSCNNLTEITLPEGLARTGSTAFMDCTNLETVILPDSLTRINAGTFYGCKKLTTINLTNNLKLIEANAFFGCTSLQTVTIPDSISYIEQNTFDNCTGLTTIVIPNNITSIGDKAFYNCIGLTDVYFSGSIEDKAKISFAEGNDCLLNATWHYNYSPADYPADSPSTDEVAITFDANGGECNTTSAAYTAGTVVGELPTPTREDYIFMGWLDANGNPFTSESYATATMTVTAQWKSTAPSADELVWEEKLDVYAMYVVGENGTIARNVPYETYLGTETGAASYSAGETVIIIASTTNYYGETWYMTHDGCWIISTDVEKSEEPVPFTLSEDTNYPDKIKLAYTACKLTGTITSLGGKMTIVNGGIFDLNGNRVYGKTVTVNAETFNIKTVDDAIAFRELGAGEYYYKITATNDYGTVNVINYKFKVVGTRDTDGYYTYVYDDKNATITKADTSISGEVVIPAVLGKVIISIGYKAFENCTNITSVTLSDNITYIGGYAFNGCSGLTSITIPDSVTDIGEGAFNGCSKLSTINYAGTQAEWNALIANGAENIGLNSNITISYNYKLSESQES